MWQMGAKRGTGRGRMGGTTQRHTRAGTPRLINVSRQAGRTRPSLVFQILLMVFALFLATASQAFVQFGRWTTLNATMPTAQSDVSAAVVRNTTGSPIIYLQGGCCPGTAVNYAYDPFNETWSTRSVANFVASYDPNINVAVGGIVYHIGGNNNGVCTNANQAYNPATDSWSQLDPMPTARCHLGVAAAANGLIYAIGGTNTSGNIQFGNVEVYNPNASTTMGIGPNMWATKTPIPTGRSNLVAVTGPDGMIYAIGGSNGSSPNLTTVEAYNPVTDSWMTTAQIAQMPMARSAAAAAVLNGLLYVVGGTNSTGVLSNTDSYNPSTNAWNQNQPNLNSAMPTARAGLSLVTIGDTLYAIGGSNADAIKVATNEAFTPTTATVSLSSEGGGLSIDPTNNRIYVSAGSDSSPETLAFNGGNLGTLPVTLSGFSDGSFDSGSTPIHLWTANVFFRKRSGV